MKAFYVTARNVRVLAKSKAAARKYAATLIEVGPMSVADVIRDSEEGYAIVDAETGKIVGNEDDVADAREEQSFAAAGVSPE